jgi:hypothetical protein
MSLYGDYILENRGDYIVENDKGFATYRYLNEGKSVYIVDIYVKPEHRSNHVASQLADEVAKTAKLTKQSIEMLGTVVPGANKSTESLQVLLNYGMKLQSIQGNMIVMSKEI